MVSVINYGAQYMQSWRCDNKLMAIGLLGRVGDDCVRLRGPIANQYHQQRDAHAQWRHDTWLCGVYKIPCPAVRVWYPLGC